MSNFQPVERVKEAKPESRRSKIIRIIFGILAIGGLIAIFAAMLMQK